MIVLVSALIMIIVPSMFQADTGMEGLIAQFASQRITEPSPLSSEDSRMSELYSYLKQYLTDVRQLTANGRAAMISEKIAELGL